MPVKWWNQTRATGKCGFLNDPSTQSCYQAADGNEGMGCLCDSGGPLFKVDHDDHVRISKCKMLVLNWIWLFVLISIRKRCSLYVKSDELFRCLVTMEKGWRTTMLQKSDKYKSEDSLFDFSVDKSLKRTNNQYCENKLSTHQNWL